MVSGASVARALADTLPLRSLAEEKLGLAAKISGGSASCPGREIPNE